MTEPALIGVDWGSTSVRAFAIARDGNVLDRRRAPDGAIVAKGDFGARLTALIGDWIARLPELPILMCGMVGSDRGWVQVPYVAAPAGLGDLAAHLMRAPFDRPVWIVPGVSFTEGETCEVMRGEETIVMGLGMTEGTICLPGTHTKWVDVEAGPIRRFRTYMTGELRSHVLSQGALAVDGDQEMSERALTLGLDAAGRGVGNALFQARARRLLGRLPASQVAAFVTGVLIGDELRHEAAPATVAAEGPLAWAYGSALSHAGHVVEIVDPEGAVARGLWRVAQAARLA